MSNRTLIDNAFHRLTVVAAGDDSEALKRAIAEVIGMHAVFRASYGIPWKPTDEQLKLKPGDMVEYTNTKGDRTLSSVRKVPILASDGTWLIDLREFSLLVPLVRCEPSVVVPCAD